jgi:ATP-dependent RNA helicase RhlB
MVRSLIRKVISRITGQKAKPVSAPAHAPTHAHAPAPSHAPAPVPAPKPGGIRTPNHGKGHPAPVRPPASSHPRGEGHPRGDGPGRGEGRGPRRSEHREEGRPPAGRGRGPRRDEHRSAEAGAAHQQTQRRHEPDAVAAPAATDWDPATYIVEPAEGKTRFADLGLPSELQHAIADLKFSYCTPIQALIMPETLKGKDAYGRAQTGTGKTAAFLITIFTRLMQRPLADPLRKGTPRALILAPTRELCIQIQKDAQSLGKYLPIRSVAIYGGMDYDKQRRQLTEGSVDIVVATPGRLIDFKKQHAVHLGHVEILVIDEADRMLDMGFIPDVRLIVGSTPHKGDRQTMFFTATLTDDMVKLASQWTVDPVKMEVAPEQVAVETVDQKVYIVTIKDKFALLYNILQRDNAQRAIVFANRRDISERLCDMLRRYQIDCALLSGAVAQEKRGKVLEAFKQGKIRVLVATDVAGRGIHVDSVSHVINFNLPIDAEDYVHRIGRTGRAGQSGISIAFADEDDGSMLPQIEKYMGRELTCTHPEDDWLVLPPPPPGAPAQADDPLTVKPYRGTRGGFRGGPRRGGPPRRR